MATLPVSLKDFLQVHFAHIKVFLPNQMMEQHLPKGQMPFKWHRWNNDCVVQDAIFNPQGPHLCHACDSSVIYLFSGSFQVYKMTRRGASRHNSYF
jgi:hypothetical protein